VKAACRSFFAHGDRVKVKHCHRFRVLATTLQQLGHEAADPILQYSKAMALDTRSFWEQVAIEKLVHHGFQMWKRDHHRLMLRPEDIALRKRIRGEDRV
jgi:hypothetical protein